ncbi:hypothetical protein [Sphingomonas sp. UYP23]
MSANVVDQVAIATNPFAILDVTTRDTRERIFEAVEDRSLMFDPDACMEARAVLTAPRRRFEAELGWFPGVAPSTAKRAMQARGLSEIEDMPLAGLAMANALAACAQQYPPGTLDDLVGFLIAMTSAVSEVTLGGTLREVNEDREIAGFPPFSSTDAAEEMLRERHQLWRRDVLSLLSRLPTTLMAEGLYRASERMAKSGALPTFMHEVIEDYALRTQPFLQEELTGAERLCEKAKDVAGSRPQALGPLIDALGELLETWEEVTRPIQRSMTILGRTDRDSERLAYMIRSLSIDLHNEHDLSEDARKLNAMLVRSFAALPGFIAKADEDREAIASFVAQKKQLEAKNTYVAEVGTFNKTRLSISSRTLEWKGRQYDVAQIRSARWGGISHSLNGIPTGTEYLIAWSDGTGEAVIKLRNKGIYEAYVERLWRVLAEPVISQIISELQTGRDLRVGAAVVRNESITLPCSKLFGEKRTQFGWHEVSFRTIDGSLVIDGPPKSKATARLSFREVANVHFFEALIRTAVTNGHARLSDAFS